MRKTSVRAERALKVLKPAGRGEALQPNRSQYKEEPAEHSKIQRLKSVGRTATAARHRTQRASHLQSAAVAVFRIEESQAGARPAVANEKS